MKIKENRKAEFESGEEGRKLRSVGDGEAEEGPEIGSGIVDVGTAFESGRNPIRRKVCGEAGGGPGVGSKGG